MRTTAAERHDDTARTGPGAPEPRSWLADLLDSAVDSYALVLGVGYASTVPARVGQASASKD